MIGATTTLASGGCVGGVGLVVAAVSGVAGVLEPNSEAIEVLVSQPARPRPVSPMTTASATLGCQRRAAAAFMVVTVTSPFWNVVC